MSEYDEVVVHPSRGFVGRIANEGALRPDPRVNGRMMIGISRQGEYFDTPVGTPIAGPATTVSHPDSTIEAAHPIRGLVWALGLSAILYIGLGLILWMTY